MIRTVFILYFNHYFSCFCQENAALWIILSVFLWMLTSKATEMKAALQRRFVQDFPVNETSMKDQSKKTPQMRLWYLLPGRSSFVAHLQGCWKGQLATSFWGSLVVMLGDLLLNFVSQLCTQCWSPQGCGRNLAPCYNTTFCIKCLQVFLPEFNSLRAKRAVLCSEVCSAPGYSHQLDRERHAHLLLDCRRFSWSLPNQ